MKLLALPVLLMILGCCGIPMPGASTSTTAETPPAPALSAGEQAAKIATAGQGDAAALAAAAQAEGLDAAGFDKLMYEVARDPVERAKYLAGAPATVKAP